MNRPTFFSGVIVAVILAFCSSAVIASLTPFVGLDAVVRLVIPAVALAYLLYLFSLGTEQIGRVTTLTLWGVLACSTWWVAPHLGLYLLIHVTAIWLIRSLYFYGGMVPALMDLGLCALSLSAAVWAITRSGSFFLATWCFFLVQALFVAIPPVLARRQTGRAEKPAGDRRFEQAKRQADRALRQLFSQ